MSVFELETDINSNLDLKRESNSFTRIGGKNQTAQRLMLRLGTGLGEYVYDPTYGLPYLTEIVTGTGLPTKNALSSYLVDEVLGVEGVLGFAEPIIYDYDVTRQTINPTMSILTADGTIETTVL